MTAVCLPLVVAPPMSSGIVIPRRVISVATEIISSSDGVIRPDRPTRSAPVSIAVVEDLVARAHHAEVGDLVAVAAPATTATMFLPMSWTSPLTVAITILPLAVVTPVRRFSASISGSRIATAFFITRADLTTWGQEHLAGAEQLADDVHAVHQRAFDDVERLGVGGQRLGDIRIR